MWRFVVNNRQQAQALARIAEKQHSEDKPPPRKKTAADHNSRYDASFDYTLMTALYGYCEKVPAMPCFDANVHAHRQRDVDTSGFAHNLDDDVTAVNAAVTRLLDRKETRSDAKALKAIRDEGMALLESKTWDESTVIEKDELLARTRAQAETIHVGELMTICSIKFAEMPANQQKYKGRVVFRGDITRDQYGAAAVFQELAASPTSIQDANSNLAYGRLPGNKTTQADAIRAYVQSELRSKNVTWVAVPRELWPDSWVKKGYKRPMCILRKALYGHPESGGHWEAHLTEAIVARGGIAVAGHPSTFWLPDSKLVLTVYVDDLLLSGPAAAHDAFWKSLRTGDKPIAIEDPEPLDRFLGRGHEEISSPSGVDLAFAMGDYCQDAVNMYSAVTGVTKFKNVPTPFVPEGSLPIDDEDTQGELANSACALLMKSLWLGRLSRPDVQKPIGDLATHVQCWSKNDDRRLFRLICYINSTKDFRLVGAVHDEPKDLKLRLYVDADFSGEREDTKSTSGGWLVLYGPNTSFPLAWISRRQTSTSRSTTESEVVSMAGALYAEGLPTMDLWDLLLGRPIGLEIMEDNQATIKVVRKGYSMKLRHIGRTHKVNLGSLKEVIDSDHVELSYCRTDDMAADIFTKALPPLKWDNALKLLGMAKTTKKATPPST